jgi:phenylacetate-CoA ligase
MGQKPHNGSGIGDMDMIWNETKECMSRDEMNALQGARLVKLVDRVYHNVEYYRKKMQAMGLEPGDIRGLEDLKKLPFTTKDDLRDTYPFGMFAVPNSQIVRIHASSGTTGKATVVGYTRRDIDMWSECVARCITMAGLGREDIIQVAYGYGLFTGGLGAHYGAEKLGATVVPMSTGNTKKLINMMVDFGATGIMCTPSYLMHIAETIEEMGVRDKIRLKASLNGAEPWTERMRDKIEEKLGIHAHDIYGLSEIMGPGVATDCRFHSGLHIHEDYFLPEIVDRETFQPVADGVTGELVISTLVKEGIPLIRYRTKDLTSIDHTPCQCGRTTARIARFTGRSDDMLIIRGVNVFPSQIETALLEMGGTTPHYLMIVDRVNNLDTLEVRVEVEERFFSDEIRELENLTRRIEQVLQQAIGLAVKVKLVEPKALERSMGKSVHVIDNRKLD